MLFVNLWQKYRSNRIQLTHPPVMKSRVVIYIKVPVTVLRVAEISNFVLYLQFIPCS